MWLSKDIDGNSFISSWQEMTVRVKKTNSKRFAAKLLQHQALKKFA